MGEGHPYFAVSRFTVSEDSRLLAFRVDSVSRRQYTIHIKDISTGKMLNDRIANTEGTLLGRGLHYIWYCVKRNHFYGNTSENFCYRLVLPHAEYHHIFSGSGYCCWITPFFRKYNITTAYEFLELRFNTSTLLGIFTKRANANGVLIGIAMSVVHLISTAEKPDAGVFIHGVEAKGNGNRLRTPPLLKVLLTDLC